VSGEEGSVRHLLGSLVLIVGLAVVGLDCTKNHGSRDAPGGPELHVKTAQVAPITFVAVYRSDFEHILKTQGKDCDGTLEALLNFVADRKKTFLEKVKDKPAAWQPEVPERQQPIQLLMDFADRCPGQLIQLNEAIHDITNPQ
jgi:hypothetical protein